MPFTEAKTLPQNAVITKTVGLWIRVSTHMQVEGDSPQVHEDRGIAYAKSKGWNVGKIYRLEGKSGKSVVGYPETQEMIKDIQDGVITGLIFTSLSRLARSTVELLDFASFFETHSADLISLTENIDTSSPSGRLFFTLFSALSQFERETTAARVAASVPIRAKQGKSLGGAAPYGYTWVNQKLELDPDEAPVRKLMCELFIQLQRIGGVATALNKRGLRTRKGARWTSTTVMRLLDDPIVSGKRRMNYTKSRGEGKHWDIKPESEWIFQDVPALISQENYQKIVSIRSEQQEKAKKRQPPRKAKYLFTGLIFCSCGEKMYVPNARMKKYSCQKCKTKMGIRDMEDIFFVNLAKTLASPTKLQAIYQKEDRHIAKLKEERVILAKQIQKLQIDMQNLLELHKNGEIPTKGFGSHYEPLSIQYDELKNRDNEIAILIQQKEGTRLDQEVALQESITLEKKWPYLKFDQKRIFVENALSKIVVNKETNEIHISYSFNPNPYPSSPAPINKQSYAALLTGVSNITHECSCVTLLTFTVIVPIPKPLGYPTELVTLEDHLKAARFDRELLQRELADILGVTEDTIRNWEKGRNMITLKNIPAVTKFLGYCLLHIRPKERMNSI